MCKKLSLLVLLILAVTGQITYASLVAYWDLEEGSGNTTTAAVGSPAADGTLVGATWITTGLPPVGGSTAAAFFNSANADRIETNYPGVLGQAARSVTAWIRAEPVQVNNGVFVGWGINSTAQRYSFRLNKTASNGTLYALRLEIQGSYAVARTPLNDGQWHHVAVTQGDGATINQMSFYVDGQPEGSLSGTSGGGLINTASSLVVLGNSGHATATYGYDGAIDEVRIYDHVLLLAEIKELAFRPRAYAPNPGNGATHQATWITLSWTPGDAAVSHDVYLGDNFDDVNAGTGDTFRGNVATPSLIAGLAGFAYPDGLVPGTTYYWRVDEVNGATPDSPWKGDVWSFTIPPQKAYDPDPADGLQFVDPSTTLGWTAGLNAKVHYAYFGDNFDDVNNATVGLVVTTTSYTPPGPLEEGKTYYWRVDEFDGAVTHKGDVRSFTAIPVVPIAGDPALVAWWTLDEGMGKTVVDWSGHGHHGTLIGNPQWVQGYDGGALRFSGAAGARAEMVGYDGVLGTQDRTVTAWIKATGLGDFISWGQNVTSQKWVCREEATAANGTVGGLRVECNGGYITGSTSLRDGQWHHVAVVLKSAGLPTTLDISLYVDGLQETISGSQAVDVNTAGGRNVWIGDGHNNRPFPGLIDDVRIYDRALTIDEISLAMRIDPLLAWQPSPPNGAIPDIDSVTPLTWARGDSASSHEIYFGLDEDAVANADTSDTTGIYRGRQNGTSFAPADGVEWGGGPYYWRIDENNNDGTISTGRIWSFSVADYLIVDDIESYNDLAEDDPASNRIYLNWIDGFGTATNGSFVGNLDVPLTERGNVHGGSQAMPLSYDNNLRFSEATLTLTGGNDWTRQGITELSLWFRGVATNVPERMYVALNGTAVVYHMDPVAVQAVTWTPWVIPLKAFADQGVNLSNVMSITIGFGTRGNTTVAGGTGQMYFDDIRLYRPSTTP